MPKLTIEGVDYATVFGLYSRGADGSLRDVHESSVELLPVGSLQFGWFCRWELPTRNGGPTSVQMHGDFVGPMSSEAKAVEAAQEDFVGHAGEPPEQVNTEWVNDR